VERQHFQFSRKGDKTPDEYVWLTLFYTSHHTSHTYEIEKNESPLAQKRKKKSSIRRVTGKKEHFSKQKCPMYTTVEDQIERTLTSMFPRGRRYRRREGNLIEGRNWDTFFMISLCHFQFSFTEYETYVALELNKK
jgi:hypothetical protein